MEVKKNEKLRFEKSSGLYFVLGLCLVLSLTYLALEWKTFHPEVAYSDPSIPMDYIPEEVPPIVKPPEPPKPKPIITPPLIEIIDNNDDQDDTIFEVPEVDSDTKIPEALEIPEYIEPMIDEFVDFIRVEHAPVFPGCENAKDKKACFQDMVLKHIRKNFKYPEKAIAMNLQGKVYVQFTVKKNGDIGELRLRGPHKILEQEASRIITKLPKMTPGKQRGTPVKVPFSMPINFVLH